MPGVHPIQTHVVAGLGTLFLMGALTLRRLEVRDLDAALRLSQAERWSHRAQDWEFHYRLGRGWAACDTDGKLLGTASWWAYGDRFGTVGLVLVDQAHQGQGIGRQLMNVVTRDAGSRVLQLVATKAGFTLYQRCGFREQHGIGQHQGTATQIPAFAVPPDTALRPVSSADLDALCALDATVFGAGRPQVISAVLDGGGGVLAHRNGRLVGFALARQSGRGVLIGPIVADGEPLAIALIAHQLKATGEFTRVDIPQAAVQLAEWLDAAGLVCVDRVTTMIRGDAREEYVAARVFGLASQALG
jgi:GNAT superfamily N-acetyltransferase